MQTATNKNTAQVLLEILGILPFEEFNTVPWKGVGEAYSAGVMSPCSF